MDLHLSIKTLFTCKVTEISVFFPLTSFNFQHKMFVSEHNTQGIQITCLRMWPHLNIILLYYYFRLQLCIAQTKLWVTLYFDRHFTKYLFIYIYIHFTKIEKTFQRTSPEKLQNICISH